LSIQELLFVKSLWESSEVGVDGREGRQRRRERGDGREGEREETREKPGLATARRQPRR